MKWGIFYNYFRDYDPITGRYVESDPIGLDGGLNTYGYVGGNALHLVDPRGLAMALPAGAGEALNLALAIGLISNMPDTKPVPNAVFNQSPVRGSAENSLISWRPNPFNNPQDNCNQARQKVKRTKRITKMAEK